MRIAFPETAKVASVALVKQTGHSLSFGDRFSQGSEKGLLHGSVRGFMSVGHQRQGPVVLKA